MAVKRKSVAAASTSATDEAPDAGTQTSLTKAPSKDLGGRDSQQRRGRRGWTAEKELRLFRAMMNHKPAGVARHFKMAVILHQMNSASDGSSKQREDEESSDEVVADSSSSLSTGVAVATPEEVWEHLGTLYDLDWINDQENNSSSSSTFAAAANDGTEDSAPVAQFQDFALPIKDFYAPLAEMKRMSGITIEDAEIYFGKTEETGKSTPSSAKRPTRSTPVASGVSSFKRRK